MSRRLHNLIERIEKNSKIAKMVSMNASVTAVRARTNTNEAYAFEAVAEQIESLADTSLVSIDGLRSILDEMSELTSTINLAGRQRMLSQRALKLHLIAERGEEGAEEAGKQLKECIELFSATLKSLKNLKFNTKEISLGLEKVEVVWRDFLDSLPRRNLGQTADLNERVLSSMHQTVQLYEDLVGH